MYSYITVLSNFVHAYDKYKKSYSKENLPQSTYPNDFYLLKEEDFQIGLNKASKLLRKVNIEGDLILRIETIPDDYGFIVHKNTRNNLGYFINSKEIKIHKLFIACIKNTNNDISLDNIFWEEISCENASAQSLKLNQLEKYSYKDLTPLSFSFLPIGIACQAKCKFCFSHSSISSEQVKKLSDYNDLETWMDFSVHSGAKRFVITGGGDPGVWGLNNLLSVIRLARPKFQKTILFTNGIFIESKSSDLEIISKITQLKNAGLDTLSLSVHHYDIEKNKFIMGVDTKFIRLISILKMMKKEDRPSVRLICVLQKEGINNQKEIDNFINFGLENDIEEICFKELYVSANTESLYSTLESNRYSEQNQVSLSLVLDYADKLGCKSIKSLPWGSPIFEFTKNHKSIRVAAYTEPSLGWELTHGIARSWNYLSDRKCYASLEDNSSQISLVTME